MRTREIIPRNLNNETSKNGGFLRLTESLIIQMVKV